MFSRLRVFLPTDRWCRALLAPVIVFVATAMDRQYLTDFWHHLARGRAIQNAACIILPHATERADAVRFRQRNLMQRRVDEVLPTAPRIR